MFEENVTTNCTKCGNPIEVSHLDITSQTICDECMEKENIEDY